MSEHLQRFCRDSDEGPNAERNVAVVQVWDMNEQVMYWLAAASNHPAISDPMMHMVCVRKLVAAAAAAALLSIAAPATAACCCCCCCCLCLLLLCCRCRCLPLLLPLLLPLSLLLLLLLLPPPPPPFLTLSLLSLLVVLLSLWDTASPHNSAATLPKTDAFARGATRSRPAGSAAGSGCCTTTTRSVRLDADSRVLLRTAYAFSQAFVAQGWFI